MCETSLKVDLTHDMPHNQIFSLGVFLLNAKRIVVVNYLYSTDVCRLCTTSTANGKVLLVLLSNSLT